MDNNLEQQKKTAQENLLQLLPPECGHLYMVGEENGIKQPHYIWLEDGKLHLRCIYFTANGTQIASYSPTFSADCTRAIYNLLKDYYKDELPMPKNMEPVTITSILDRPVMSFDFTNRALKCMRGAGIKTVRDLVKIKDGRELLRMRNFGKLSLTEITEWLTKNNLYFGMEV